MTSEKPKLEKLSIAIPAAYSGIADHLDQKLRPLLGERSVSSLALNALLHLCKQHGVPFGPPPRYQQQALPFPTADWHKNSEAPGADGVEEQTGQETQESQENTVDSTPECARQQCSNFRPGIGLCCERYGAKVADIPGYEFDAAENHPDEDFAADSPSADPPPLPPPLSPAAVRFWSLLTSDDFASPEAPRSQADRAKALSELKAWGLITANGKRGRGAKYKRAAVSRELLSTAGLSSGSVPIQS